MSDEARHYVKTHSPYAGQTFWLHYVLGDIANAQHDYELWIGERALMDEWPFSRAAVARGFAELIRDGYLEVVQRPAPGRRARYRLVFKGAEGVAKNVSRSDTRSANVSRGETNVSRDAKRTLLIGTEKELKPTRDEIFDALVDVCGIQVSALTTSARGPLNRAVKELRQVDATADTIKQVARAYRKKWPEALISPTALAKFYPTFLRSEAVTEPSSGLSGQTCHACQGTGWEPIDDPVSTVIRCQTCGGMGVVELERAN